MLLKEKSKVITGYSERRRNRRLDISNRNKEGRKKAREMEWEYGGTNRSRDEIVLQGATCG